MDVDLLESLVLLLSISLCHCSSYCSGCSFVLMCHVNKVDCEKSEGVVRSAKAVRENWTRHSPHRNPCTCGGESLGIVDAERSAVRVSPKQQYCMPQLANAQIK